MASENIYYQSQIDDDEWKQSSKEKKSGYVEAICNIFKSQMGVSIMAFSFSMNGCGIGYGLIIQLTTTLMMLYGVRKLVKIADEVQKPKLFYPELVEQILGNRIAQITAILLASLSIGCCIAYLIFFHLFIQEVFSYAGIEANDLSILAVTLAILIPFIFINNFHILNMSSGFAMLLTLFTISYIMYYDINYIEKNQVNLQEDSDLFKLKGVPAFIGMAVFASEGIPCVFHIRDSMERPRNFMIIFSGTVLCILGLYVMFGSVNILTFGSSVNEMILINIPYASYASFIAKIGFAFAVLLTYPVQIFPVSSMLESTLLEFSKNAKLENMGTVELYKVYGIRLSMMATLCLIAYMIPEFSGIMSVLGAVSGIITQYIIPLIMDNVYHGKNKPQIYRIIDNIFIFLSSIFAIFCGYISLIALIEDDKQK